MTNTDNTQLLPFIGPCSDGTVDHDGFAFYCQCDDCGEMYRAEAAAEQYAEGAWLRAAENAIPQHELDYELAMEAQDVGLIYMRSQRDDDGAPF